jgi:hypothetical protein
LCTQSYRAIAFSSFPFLSDGNFAIRAMFFCADCIWSMRLGWTNEPLPKGLLLSFSPGGALSLLSIF